MKIKNIKLKQILCFAVLISFVLALVPKKISFAATSYNVVLSDENITVNGSNITNTKTDALYLSTATDDGLGDDSTKIEIANIVNITKEGDYTFSGTLSDGQIAIDSNTVTGNINIILNNCDITCKNAPAIFVYGTDIENTSTIVTISTTANSVNNIEGGKIKQSVLDYENQSDLIYYLDKGYDDDKLYYERYKYDGAISSDISLTFEGSGTLNVTSSKKEGIESKMNLTFNSGTINIVSADDGINASCDNKSKIVINDGLYYINIDKTADEGEGIDSNGSIEINGGTVYTFACTGSDNGLDADNGITINGGTVFSTGDMSEKVSAGTNVTVLSKDLSKSVEEGQVFVIVDSSNNPIFGYQTDRTFKTFVYSSELLTDDSKVYVGNSSDIVGTVSDSGIYSQISSVNIDNMDEMSFSQSMQNDFERKTDNRKKSSTKIYEYVLVGAIIVLVIVICIYVIMRKNEEKEGK